MATERKVRSPYQRHQKAPYQYSAELREWQRAAKAGRGADHADGVWRRMMSRRGQLVECPAQDVPRPLRRQCFPAGVAPFNPHTKPAARPFLMAAE